MNGPVSELPNPLTSRQNPARFVCEHSGDSGCVGLTRITLVALFGKILEFYMADPFILRAINVLRRIPRGRVATYGQVATLAGSPRAARQVVRVLHSSSGAARLPWHRVINGKGNIALPHGQGFEVQAAMLRDEGVMVDDHGAIDLRRFQWRPRS